MFRIFKEKQGFSLVELLTVVALVGIIAGIGTLSTRDIRARFRLKSATLDLYSDMQMARLGAIREGRNWNICFSPGNTSFTEYNINNDAAGLDGAFCTADDVVAASSVVFRKNVNLSNQNDIVFEENFSGTGITFNPRGTASSGNVALTLSGLTSGRRITANGLTGNLSISTF